MIEWTWQAKRSCRDDYLDPHRRAVVYPMSHRFKDCCCRTGLFDPLRAKAMQPQRFAVMWAAREISRLKLGVEVWQERYKLAEQTKRRHSYARCNMELASRLGSEVKASIEQSGKFIRPAFKDPDVVVFDPTSKTWQFIEVKLIQSRDDWRRGQRESLAVLEELVPSSVSILLRVDLVL